jgi:hypothetical protein
MPPPPPAAASACCCRLLLLLVLLLLPLPPAGTFTQAKLPKVGGIQDFEGEMFHTSRWNYEYTGGSSTGGLDKLVSK